MPYRKNPVGTLIKTDPKKARALILAAFDPPKTKLQVEVAFALGVSEITFIRWLDTLGIAGKVKKLRKTTWRRGPGAPSSVPTVTGAKDRKTKLKKRPEKRS